MKPRSRLFRDPLYQVDIVGLRCLPEDISRAVLRMKIVAAAQDTITQYFNKKKFDGMNGHAARVDCHGSLEYAVVWFRPTAQSSTIAHEAFHTTHSILSNAGLTLTDASEEAYAYHLAWVIRELNHLWGKP